MLGQDGIGQGFQGNVGGAGKLGQHLLPLLGGLWVLSYGTAMVGNTSPGIHETVYD